MTSKLLIPCVFLFLSSCSVHVYHHGKKGSCKCNRKQSICQKCSSGKCTKKQCALDMKDGKGCCCAQKKS